MPNSRQAASQTRLRFVPIVRTATLMTVGISNTLDFRMDRSSRDLVFMAFRNCRAGRLQVTSARWPFQAQDVLGILLTSPDRDWMPSRLPTGRPEQGCHGYSTATLPHFHLSSCRTVTSRDNQSRRSHLQSCVVRFAPMET